MQTTTVTSTVTLTLDDRPTKREGLIMRRMLQRAAASIIEDEKKAAKRKYEGRQSGPDHIDAMLRTEALQFINRMHAELSRQGVGH